MLKQLHENALRSSWTRKLREGMGLRCSLGKQAEDRLGSEGQPGSTPISRPRAPQGFLLAQRARPWWLSRPCPEGPRAVHAQLEPSQPGSSLHVPSSQNKRGQGWARLRGQGPARPCCLLLRASPNKGASGQEVGGWQAIPFQNTKVVLPCLHFQKVKIKTGSRLEGSCRTWKLHLHSIVLSTIASLVKEAKVGLAPPRFCVHSSKPLQVSEVRHSRWIMNGISQLDLEFPHFYWSLNKIFIHSYVINGTNTWNGPYHKTLCLRVILQLRKLKYELLMWKRSFLHAALKLVWKTDELATRFLSETKIKFIF